MTRPPEQRLLTEANAAAYASDPSTPLGAVIANAIAPKLDGSFDALAGAVSYASDGFNTHALNTARYYGQNRTSAGAQNNYVTFLLPYFAPGVWNLALHHFTGADRGTYYLATSSDGLAWAELGKVDGYAASGAAARTTVSNVTIPEQARYLRVRMETKNASSTSYVGDISAVSGVQLSGTVVVKNAVVFERAGTKYAIESAEKAWSFQPDRNLDRFELRDGDKWVNESVNNLANRTELRYKGAPGGSDSLPYSTDVWLSYALKLDEGDPLTGWAIFGQIHATEDGTDTSLSPVWALEINNTTMSVRTRSSTLNPTTAAETSTVHHSSPFARGQWYRFVARLRFEKGTGGYMQLWKNGVEVFNAPVMMGYNDTAGPYWKYGIYRAESAATTVASYANVEIGTASLLDRVANPLPLP